MAGRAENEVLPVRAKAMDALLLSMANCAGTVFVEGGGSVPVAWSVIALLRVWDAFDDDSQRILLQSSRVYWLFDPKRTTTSQ